MIITIIKCVLEWLSVFYFISTINNVFNNDKFGNKTKIVLFLTCSLAVILYFIPREYFPLNTIVSFIIYVLAVTLILKVKILKGCLEGIAYLIFTFICEFISVIIVSLFLHSDVREYFNSSINGQIIFTLIYFSMIFLIISLINIILSKKSKIKSMTKFFKSKQFVGFVMIILLTMMPEIILIAYNRYYYSLGFLIMNLLQILIISIYMMYSVYTYLEKEKLKEDNIELKVDNDSMTSLIDGVRSIKHDFNNIFQAIHGYITIGAYEKLNDYVLKIMKECNILNTITFLNTDIFDDPGVFGVVGSKHYSATHQGILFEIDVTTKITAINFPSEHLCRIFGILLNNALEATSKVNSQNQYVKLEIHFNKKKNANVIRIYNTYDTNLKIDLNKIYEKGYSSKKVKSGIGLWEVRNLVNNNPKSQIFASIENGMFIQNLIIED